MNALRRPTIELAPSGRSLAEHVALTQLAAANGWGGVWVSEVAGLDAVTQAVAAGRALGAGRVGTAIVPMQTRDPLLMAMTAATLNQLMPGRFVLGLGTSTRIIMEDWHSTEWGAPLALTREYVTLVRRFLNGERVTFQGPRYRYRGASLGTGLAAPVPIYLAALNDRMLELAGELADGVLLNFASLEYLAHARERLAVGAERAGRSVDDIDVLVFFRCSFAEDYARVRERYQREFLTYALAPVYQKMFGREGFDETCAEVTRLWTDGQREAALAAIPDALPRNRALIGTPAEVAKSLDLYFEAGMRSAIVMPVPAPGTDYIAECERIVSVLGREMGPGGQTAGTGRLEKAT